MLSVIEFTFNYPEIGYLRIEHWLDTAWFYYYSAGNHRLPNNPTMRDKARAHDYENF